VWTANGARSSKRKERGMSVSILEVLMNAQMNFETASKMVPGLGRHPIFAMASEQLKNGIEALENGQSIHDEYAKGAP